jgi:hypothetical protein
MRPGGVLKQNGVTYVAQDKTFPDFKLGGKYLLFVHVLPETHSFMAFTGGCFLISGSNV